MSVPVRIPSPLRPFAGGQSVVEVEGATVGDVLKALGEKHKELVSRLRGEDGRLRSHVRIYVNDEDVRFLEDEKTPLKPGDTIAIIPAIAGG
jgi:molybdopterin synthase sulfur carrier subunit